MVRDPVCLSEPMFLSFARLILIPRPTGDPVLDAFLGALAVCAWAVLSLAAVFVSLELARIAALAWFWLG